MHGTSQQQNYSTPCHSVGYPYKLLTGILGPAPSWARDIRCDDVFSEEEKHLIDDLYRWEEESKESLRHKVYR